MPNRLTFAIRVTDSFDIPSEDSLSLSMPGVAGLLLLLGDELPCFGPCNKSGTLDKIKGF